LLEVAASTLTIASASVSVTTGTGCGGIKVSPVLLAAAVSVAFGEFVLTVSLLSKTPQTSTH